MKNLAHRWQQLLSNHRVGAEGRAEAAAARSDFQRDYDRVAFSSAFRRLQDKTQVFPLAESDYVRTRLTHSLEASCVGRSLGNMVGEKILARHRPREIQAADFGAVVAAACLAHDIGNPPFGHSGEDAIRHWFEGPAGARLLARLSPAQQADFTAFEGNAQGFRLLTRLQSPDNVGGMQLTAAVLATFSKYPRRAELPPAVLAQAGISGKKHGFFVDDEKFFEEAAERTGMSARGPGLWQRHPLAFLVEAADDICYRIVDLEDGFRQGCVDYATTRELLLALVTDAGKRYEIEGRLERMSENSARIGYLRATAIGVLVSAVAEVFMQHEAGIVDGSFDHELLLETGHAEALKAIQRVSIDHIYAARPVVEIEAAGFEVLGGLLDAFATAVHRVAKHGHHAPPHAKTLVKLLPAQFLGPEGRPDPDPYRRLLGVTDYVSGMTDTFAVATFKKLRGISLPNG